MAGYLSRGKLYLGMPLTSWRGINEVALLSHVAHIRWVDFGTASGCAATNQRDAEGNFVYASVFYVDISGFPDSGLATWGPDDALETASTLQRFGRTMLDGETRLYPDGSLPDPAPDPLPAAPTVRMSNVLVRVGAGPHDLQIAPPANSRVEAIPALGEEPDSYRLIQGARRAGRFWDPPAEAKPLWSGPRTVECTINPDRDMNGVGLLYFVSYVAFLDVAERRALEESGAFEPAALDGRSTCRRRIGFYGNALPRDRLCIDVEAFLDARNADRLHLHHRIRRASDDRLIAVSSVEKRLRG